MVLFDEILHRYTTENGTEIPGVTSILQDMQLAPSYKGVSKDKLDQAAEAGTVTHYAHEVFIKSNSTDDSADEDVQWFAQNLYPTMSNWQSELIIDTVGKGLPCDYAGKLDMIAKKPDGKFALGDLKTTSVVHKDAVAWQLSMYRLAWCLEHNVPVEDVSLFCLHAKNGKHEVIDIKPIPEEEICNMLQCYKDDIPYIPKTAVISSDMASKVLALEEQISAIDQQKKLLENAQAQIKEAIYQAMTEKGVTKWESENLALTVVAPTTKKSLDSKAVQAKFPEIAEDASCWKTSNVKGYLKITLKESR